MPAFEWTDKLAVNIGVVDEQHQRLVALINELDQAILDGRGRDALDHILTELLDYAQYHFEAEETLMLQYDFPRYESHKDEHGYFTDKVLELQEDFRNGSASITSTVMRFLTDWLSHHIRVTDKGYSPFLIGKGVT